MTTENTVILIIGVLFLAHLIRCAFFSKKLMPESLYSVDTSDKEITCTDSNGNITKALWADIRLVTIRTTNEGPSKPDVYWLFYTSNDDPTVIVVGGATGESQMMQAMETKLPGLNVEAVIAAMGCTSNREFICWKADN